MDNSEIIEKFADEVYDTFGDLLTKADRAAASERIDEHTAHYVQLAYFGHKDMTANIAIVCEDCQEVLFDSDVTEAAMEE